MTIPEQIESHINSQPEAKRSEMQELHRRILNILPDMRLWFDDGKNESGKIVTNPTAGYGFQVMKYTNGKTKDFFRIGMSANTSGISIYILGIDDKTYLTRTYAATLGKATVTGYCIKFKTLKDINIEVLESAIRYGLQL